MASKSTTAGEPSALSNSIFFCLQPGSYAILVKGVIIGYTSFTKLRQIKKIRVNYLVNELKEVKKNLGGTMHNIKLVANFTHLASLAISF